MQKLQETLQYIYDPNWIPQNLITITEQPSETIQNLSINHNNIEKKNYSAENLSFTRIQTTDNANMSIEASPIEKLDTIVHSQPNVA